MSANPVLTSADRAELAAEEERPLDATTFAARIAAPWTDWEREDFDGLVRWFTKRYPTPLDRLRAMRRRVRAMPR